MHNAHPVLDGLRFSELVPVARPTLPPLDGLAAHLEVIWRSGQLTNTGQYHMALEARLAEYLGVQHCSLFCNGTVALTVALHALELEGEVITTPFTFPATLDALYWNGLTPVFCDIDPDTYNLDPARVEAAVTSRTAAILAVHVYGTPCDTTALREIAARHGVALVYDAAHAFGARWEGQALAAHGDVAMLSFHATKLMSTVEGGLLVIHDAALKQRVDRLRNFGIVDEELVDGPGTNGKLSELHAAFGLLHLEMVDHEIERRQTLAAVYEEVLRKVPGLRTLRPMDGLDRNYAYYPVTVDQATYGSGRDRLASVLRRCNVGTRRYFYPLTSWQAAYRGLPSAQPDRLPVAERVARGVLCLPMYGQLRPDQARGVAAIIEHVHARPEVVG